MPGGSIDGSGSDFRSFRINDLEMVAQICPRWNPLTSWMRQNGRVPESRVGWFPKRKRASRPTSIFLVNPSLFCASPIERVGCCSFWIRCFGPCWDNRRDSSTTRRVLPPCAGLAVPVNHPRRHPPIELSKPTERTAASRSSKNLHEVGASTSIVSRTVRDRDVAYGAVLDDRCSRGASGSPSWAENGSPTDQV